MKGRRVETGREGKGKEEAKWKKGRKEGRKKGKKKTVRRFSIHSP